MYPAPAVSAELLVAAVASCRRQGMCGVYQHNADAVAVAVAVVVAVAAAAAAAARILGQR